MIDLRYVKKLIDILDESTVDSIEISSDKGMKIRISKSPTGRGAMQVAAPAVMAPMIAPPMLSTSHPTPAEGSQAVEQAADLHHPHVVVGVAEIEEADIAPFAVNEPGAEAEPDEQHKQFPLPVDDVDRPRFPVPVLALPHFSGCSRSTSNGKQAAHGDQIKR